MKNKPKVLITYIESGMGHIMSMQALSDALKNKFSNELDIVETEIMRDTENSAQIWFEKFLTAQTKLTNKVSLFGPFIFFIMNLGKQKFMRFVHHTLFKKATDGTVEAFLHHKPDVIVSTHYFITFAAMEYKRRVDPSVIVASYNPDNNVHVWWDNRSDLFITNNNEATKEAVDTRKFNPDSVKQVFFTARDAIVNAEKTKQEYRKKYGIPEDKFAVILADGAYADGKAKHFADELLKTDKSLTIVLLAGKNKKVYNYFCKKKVSPNITLIPFEFTPEAYELYSACDLFITKGGPNAVIDSLFMKTPVLINYCPHPIEKATATLFVEKMGCGIIEFNKKKAKKLVESFVDNPKLLDSYHISIDKHIDKRNNGAKQAAQIIFDAVVKRNNEKV